MRRPRSRAYARIIEKAQEEAWQRKKWHSDLGNKHAFDTRRAEQAEQEIKALGRAFRKGELNETARNSLLKLRDEYEAWKERIRGLQETMRREPGNKELKRVYEVWKTTRTTKNTPPDFVEYLAEQERHCIGMISEIKSLTQLGLGYPTRTQNGQAERYRRQNFH